MRPIHTNVEIITIGDEILIGQTIDSNAAWVGEHLAERGFFVRRITTIPDDPTEIIGTLDNAIPVNDLIILTGGLGPTGDDLTKDTLARYFGGELVPNERVLLDIKELFKERRIPMNHLNRDQSMVPSNCKIIRNFQGTAPGMWFTKDGCEVISLPGVPYEMKAIMERDILDQLQRRFNTQPVQRRVIMTTGIPESMLAHKIASWESQLPDQYSLAYLPSPGLVKLRLTAVNVQKEVFEKDVSELAKRLMTLLPEALFSLDGENLESVVGKQLKKCCQTVAFAESCTGGFLSHLITCVPGSSNYFRGSIVAYANEIKREYLDVDQQILNEYGAVSEPTVRQMADIIRKKFNVDYGVAVSGIAGPTGGSKEKPVGTVWIAISSCRGVNSEYYQMGDHRVRTIIKTSMAALNMLRLTIQ